jgi:tRNA threonylcarbamoyl adenosine modification protein YeaZ
VNADWPTILASGSILVIDTATSQVVAAVAAHDGRLVGSAGWAAGHRHGRTLLPAIERLLVETNIPRTSLGGIVVGTGPGAFTGLRVGIATAKGLATALDLPIVGIATSDALAASAAAATDVPPERIVVVLPAGPRDRVLCRHDRPPRLLPAGEEPDIASGEYLCAVDLDGRVPDDAAELGRHARDGLGGAMAALGSGRLRAGGSDDLASLVAEYVTLPRGVREIAGEVAWSHGRR